MWPRVHDRCTLHRRTAKRFPGLFLWLVSLSRISVAEKVLGCERRHGGSGIIVGVIEEGFTKYLLHDLNCSLITLNSTNDALFRSKAHFEVVKLQKIRYF